MTAPRNPRFPLFDSLRAIAALSVLLFHIAFVLEGFTDPNWGRYATQLNIGVPIFFLISGFLLYRPFAQARYDGRALPSIRGYATRRLFRIVPAYWVAITVIALPAGLLWFPFGLIGSDLPVVFDHPYFHYTFTHVFNRQDLLTGVGHTWTLAVEMQFYVFLPVWAFLLRQLPRGSDRQFVLTEALPLVAIFAIGLLWNLTMIERTAGNLVLFSPEVAVIPRFLDHFALGMGLAVASVVLAGRERRPSAVRLVEDRPWVPWLLAGLGFVVLANLGANYISADVEPVRHELRGLIALGLLAPAVFGETRGGTVRRVLAWPPLVWVGLVSYSLYLWHPAIAQKIVYTQLDENIGWVVPAMLAVVASIAVAAVSFYAIERPALRAGRTLARRHERRPEDDVTARAGAP
ncbi:MAG: acyltransferase [Actinomycetota bacterium]|nr:acyltransferase [Actinomycetota bacterium]